MSKAFTKETESEADFEDEIPALPAGTKNYITPEGLRRLQDEFAQLQKTERPKTVETVAWAAGNGDRSRMAIIFTASGACAKSTGACGFCAKEWKSPKSWIRRAKRTGIASFSAPPSLISMDTARKRPCGSSASTRRVRSSTKSAGFSPVGKALLKASEGECVEVRTPKGIERLEILKILY